MLLAWLDLISEFCEGEDTALHVQTACRSFQTEM